MARFQLLPAETRFFDWFEKGSANLLHTTRLLQSLFEDFSQDSSGFQALKQAEHEGDTIVHQIHDLLLKTLITPLDPEETRALSQAIDDVVDAIEQVAILMRLYRVEQPTEEARALARILVNCGEQINLAMPLLRDKKQFGQLKKHIVEVHRLENEADELGRKSLEYLVDNCRHDWFEFMRWKEIYALLEDATDLCEDIADVLESVLVKNG